MRASTLAAISLISIVPACKSAATGQRQWVTCTCEYVTDFDQPGKIVVDVCSEEPSPTSTAESCARGAGVGAVTGCVCSSSNAGRCASRDLCRTAPAAPASS